MKSFGFSIIKPRAIDLDKAETSWYPVLAEKIPSIQACIMCGSCTATCSVQEHTAFSFRKSHLLFRHGQFDGLAAGFDKCMLCGKCSLICPRGVNTRAAIVQMRLMLREMNINR